MAFSKPLSQWGHPQNQRQNLLGLSACPKQIRSALNAKAKSAARLFLQTLPQWDIPKIADKIFCP